MAVILPPIVPPADEPSSFDAPYGLYADHARRQIIVTNIIGEPALSAEFLGETTYWEALALSYDWQHSKGYELIEREWHPDKHDPDQLRGYLPFADESEITS